MKAMPILGLVIVTLACLLPVRFDAPRRYERHLAELSPTKEELSRFRFCKSTDGLYGVEVFLNNHWETGPHYNVWKSTNEATFDIGWWIEAWRVEKVRTWDTITNKP